LSYEKKTRNKRWKSYCNDNCTNCNSIFFVKSAQRYCYEDKFDLPTVPQKMLYKENNKVHIVATGVIEHINYSKNSNSEHENFNWEKNLKKIRAYNKDRYQYIIKELCKNFDIEHKKFMRVLKKIVKELA
jgi:hypothetical protein